MNKPHGAWLVSSQQWRHVNDNGSLPITNLLYCFLMNITYFFTSFVAGRCFYI